MTLQRTVPKGPGLVWDDVYAALGVSLLKNSSAIDSFTELIVTNSGIALNCNYSLWESTWLVDVFQVTTYNPCNDIIFHSKASELTCYSTLSLPRRWRSRV